MPPPTCLVNQSTDDGAHLCIIASVHEAFLILWVYVLDYFLVFQERDLHHLLEEKVDGLFGLYFKGSFRFIPASRGKQGDGVVEH